MQELEAATREVAVTGEDDPSLLTEEQVHTKTALALMDKPEVKEPSEEVLAEPSPPGDELSGLATRDENFAKVCEIWQRRVGMMGPTQHQKLEFWFVEQEMSAELLDMVLDVSVMRAGEVRPWGYLEKILRDWVNLGALDRAGVYEKEPATISDLRRGGFDYPPVKEKEKPKAVEGVANASAYQRVDRDLVDKCKSMYPDEYDE